MNCGMESTFSSLPSLSLTTNDGEVLAAKLVGDIITPISELNLPFHEQLCKSALEENREGSTLAKHNAARKNLKKVDRKPVDIFSKLNTYTSNQIKNQNYRFSLDENESKDSQQFRQSWGFKGFYNIAQESKEYEDVLSEDILDAPICDLCIVQSSEQIPPQFYRHYKTPDNRKANINSSTGGNPLYICLKKDLTGKLPPITNILLFSPDRGEHLPPGYHILQKGNIACNLNAGTSSERLYLCFKRDFLSNPVTDVQVIFPTKGEEVQKNFVLLEKTISGQSANLNLGTNAMEIFLSYRQSFVRLQCLTNESDRGDNPSKVRASRRSVSTDTGSVGLAAGGVKNRGQSRSPMRERFPSQDLTAVGKPPATTIFGGPAVKSKATDETDKRDFTHAFKTETSTMGSMSSVPEYLDDALDATISNTGDDIDQTKTTNSLNQHDSYDDFMILEEESAEEAIQIYEDYKDFELVNLRKQQCVVSSLGGPISAKLRKSLFALLSSLYIRQGQMAEQVVQGLSKLLKDTNFFEQDLQSLPLPNTVTMLDLAIESVCDRFDLAIEAEYPTLLNFLKVSVKHSGARLSSISLQRMFRAILFLCNLQSAKPTWMSENFTMPCNDPGVEMTPYKILKTLIWDIVSQVETVNIIATSIPEYSVLLDTTGHPNTASPEDSCNAKGWKELSEASSSVVEVRSILLDFIDDIIDSVEISRHCEHVLLLISKQSVNISSNFFWQQTNMFAKKFFVESTQRSAYVILCAVCKLAWNGIRLTKQGEYNSRELGLKLIALESIQELLSCAGEKMRLSKVMGYQIRRLIVPCLLFNISYALVDHRIFAKLMKVITALWKVWRRHIRIEFAILCEQLIFKVLQASVLQIRPVFQMIVIQEIVNWFDQPYILIEMFVNYDLDRKFVSHWNTFSYVVRSICAIGRRLTLVTGAWDWRHASLGINEEQEKVAVTIRDVHLEALEEVSRIAKTLMDASGHAYLIQQDKTFRDRSLGETAGWVEDEEDANKFENDEDVSVTDKSSPISSPAVSLNEIENVHDTPPSRPRVGRAGSIRLRRAAHQESESLINQAIEIYTKKNNLKKAIDFLISKGFMPDTPQEIANFLRVYKNSFDPVAIGDFLGEGGINPIEEDYWSQIRFRYTRAISFVEMHLEPALRLYLTNGGFRLPGEAQKINRFVEVFVKTFWQDNRNTVYCPFQHSDTLHLLAYAIIMLNTDLHRASHHDSKNKKHKKMTKEEFTNNLRGIDQGQDIAKEYLSTVYDTIAQNPMELTVKSSSNTVGADEFNLLADIKTISNDILATVLRNAPGGAQNANGTPAAASSNPVSNELRIREEKKFIQEVCTTIRDAEDLLRSLSSFTFRFYDTNVDIKISLDMVSYMYETVWFHFHAIIESILQADDAEINVKFLALDILCYSLTSAIFLDLKQERLTFAHLLQKFRTYCESLPHASANISTNSEEGADGAKSTKMHSSISTGIIRKIPDDSWYYDITGAAPPLSSNISTNSIPISPKGKSKGNRLEIVGKLHHLMVHIKDIIQESSTYEQTRKIAAKFEKKAKVLEKNSFYVKSGELFKLNRTGRSIAYHFFLFSNYLYYTHYASMKKEYIVHEELSLNALSVSDMETDPTFCSFYISHPVKSFVVICASPQDKQLWLREINQTIANCHKREIVAVNGVVNRRMSIVSRLESQQIVQRQETEQLTRMSMTSASSLPLPLLQTPNTTDSLPLSSPPFSETSKNDTSEIQENTVPTEFVDEEGSSKYKSDVQELYEPQNILADIVYQSAPFLHTPHMVKVDTNVSVIAKSEDSEKVANGRSGTSTALDTPPRQTKSSTRPVLTHDISADEEFLQIQLDLISDEEDAPTTPVGNTSSENTDEAGARLLKQQGAIQTFQQLITISDEEMVNRLFSAVSVFP